MSKIICDVCGSRYPDTAAQCPICGCINNKVAKAPAEDREPAVKTELPERTSTPGGRFSKANVNKRNEGKTFTEEPATRVKREKPQAKPQIQEDYDLEEDFEEETGKKRGGFVNVLLVLVIVALLGVCAYLFIQFFMPSFFGSDSIIAPTEPVVAATEAPTEAPAPTLPPMIPCEKLVAEEATVTLTEAGQVQSLNIQVMPENSTDGLIYISSNEEVATVNEKGEVTAVGEGSVVITAFCGAQQLECNVICNFSGAPVTEPVAEPATEPAEQTGEEAPAATEAPAETGEKKTVTSNNLNIREDAGAKKKKVGAYKKGDEIIILETKKVSGQEWGRTDQGWVCLDFVK